MLPNPYNYDYMINLIFVYEYLSNWIIHTVNSYPVLWKGRGPNCKRDCEIWIDLQNSFVRHGQGLGRSIMGFWILEKQNTWATGKERPVEEINMKNHGYLSLLLRQMMPFDRLIAVMGNEMNLDPIIVSTVKI